MSNSDSTSSESTNTMSTTVNNLDDINTKFSYVSITENITKELVIGCGEPFRPIQVIDKPKFRTFSYGNTAKPEDMNTITFNNTPLYMVFNDINPAATILAGTYNIAMLCDPEHDDIVLHKPFVHLVDCSGKSMGIIFIRDYQNNLMLFNTKQMLNCNPDKCKTGNYCYGINCSSIFHTKWLEVFFEKIQDNINNNKIKVYKITGIEDKLSIMRSKMGEKQKDRESQTLEKTNVR